MAKRNQQHPLVAAADPSTSKRWPNLFANEQAVEALVHSPEWAVVLADLRDKVAVHSYDIVHGLPKNSVDEAEQNFMRGKVSAFEDLIGLAEEYREWKESK